MAHVHLHFGNGGKKRANLSALAHGSFLTSWWQRDKKEANNFHMVMAHRTTGKTVEAKI